MVSQQGRDVQDSAQNQWGNQMWSFFPAYQVIGPNGMEGGGRFFLMTNAYTMVFPLSFVVYEAGSGLQLVCVVVLGGVPEPLSPPGP